MRSLVPKSVASQEERDISKAKKKAMAQLKKDTRVRARAIRKGDPDALEGFMPKRAILTNTQAIMLAAVISVILTIFLAYYAERILIEMGFPIDSDSSQEGGFMPFFWDYNSGFNTLGLQIFSGTLVTLFLLLKLGDRRTRVRIRNLVSEAQIWVWECTVWSLGKIRDLYDIVLSLGISINDRMRSRLEGVPGLFKGIPPRLSEEYGRFSKWLTRAVSSLRVLSGEWYLRIDNSIQRSRDKRLQRREAANSDLTRKYRKIRHLNSDGGMAEVYLVRDRSSGVDLIWKQASPSRKNRLDSVNLAIENEAEILRSIDHDRVPKCVDSGIVKNEDDEVVQVLLMEYIEGSSLDQEVKVFQNSRVIPPFDRVMETILQICEVLEYLADLDPPIYHRDIKPHNVMTQPERGVVLIDFGLAKEIASGGSVSLSGGAHTEGWSPPERARSISGGFTDVYGLGQIMWQMLTNEAPGIYQEEYRAQKLVSLGHPSWVSNLVNEATFPSDPAMRLQSVAEFRARLEEGHSF